MLRRDFRGLLFANTSELPPVVKLLVVLKLILGEYRPGDVGPVLCLAYRRVVTLGDEATRTAISVCCVSSEAAAATRRGAPSVAGVQRESSCYPQVRCLWSHIRLSEPCGTSFTRSCFVDITRRVPRLRLSRTRSAKIASWLRVRCIYSGMDALNARYKATLPSYLSCHSILPAVLAYLLPSL